MPSLRVRNGSQSRARGQHDAADISILQLSSDHRSLPHGRESFARAARTS